MNVLVFGSSGFVGLNIVEALLAGGHGVIGFDRAAVPAPARAVFGTLPGHLEELEADVTDRTAIAHAVRPGLDAIVLGAAITADAARDAADPETILQVNLMAQIPILEHARRSGTRRVINLSSGIVYGGVGAVADELTEEGPVDPVGLYAVSKYATERVGARLASLWSLDHVNVRLSTVFGPWEHATGVRDTLSPQSQLAGLLGTGEAAVLERPGLRDWVYAPDVASAVLRLIEADRLGYRLFNVSAPTRWTVLDWGTRLATLEPGFVCRVAKAGESPTVRMHSPGDRAPLSIARMRDDLGWQARFGMADSADHFMAWWRDHGRELGRSR